MEAIIPKTMRWIPKGMTVSYLKIAKTDLTAECEIEPERLESPGDFQVIVKVYDRNSETVANAEINMHLTFRKGSRRREYGF